MGEAANEKKLRSVSHKSQTVSEPVSQLTYTLFTELKKQIRKCGGLRASHWRESTRRACFELPSQTKDSRYETIWIKRLGNLEAEFLNSIYKRFDNWLIYLKKPKRKENSWHTSALAKQTESHRTVKDVTSICEQLSWGSRFTPSEVWEHRQGGSGRKAMSDSNTLKAWHRGWAGRGLTALSLAWDGPSEEGVQVEGSVWSPPAPGQISGVWRDWSPAMRKVQTASSDRVNLRVKVMSMIDLSSQTMPAGPVAQGPVAPVFYALLPLPISVSFPSLFLNQSFVTTLCLFICVAISSYCILQSRMWLLVSFLSTPGDGFLSSVFRFLISFYGFH